MIVLKYLSTVVLYKSFMFKVSTQIKKHKPKHND